MLDTENIELKIEIKEKLYEHLKTIAKEEFITREHLSEEILTKYVYDHEDRWLDKVGEVKEEDTNLIELLDLEEPKEEHAFLDLIVKEDIYYALKVIAGQKMITVDRLVNEVLKGYTDGYNVLLEEKDKEKIERKEKQKHQKEIQKFKKAKKKEREKDKRIGKMKKIQELEK